MNDKERFDELEIIIQKNIEEKNRLKDKINRENLINLQGEYYMVLRDDAEYLMFDTYNEKTRSIGCWLFTTERDCNGENSYIIEKTYFYSVGDLPPNMQWIPKEDFDELVKQFLSDIKMIMFNEEDKNGG